MVDLKELDKDYVVTIKPNKSYRRVYLHSKRDMYFGQTTSVSEAFSILKDKGWQFYCNSDFKNTYKVAFALNTELGIETEDLMILLTVAIMEDRKEPYKCTESSSKRAKDAFNKANFVLKLPGYDVTYFNNDDEAVLTRLLNEAKEMVDRKTEEKLNYYAVIRKLDGENFKSNSYAKVVNASLLKPTNNAPIALFNGQPVYVQNVGSKEFCDKVQNRIKAILDYKKIGEDW